MISEYHAGLAVLITAITILLFNFIDLHIHEKWIFNKVKKCQSVIYTERDCDTCMNTACVMTKHKKYPSFWYQLKHFIRGLRYDIIRRKQRNN